MRDLSSQGQLNHYNHDPGNAVELMSKAQSHGNCNNGLSSGAQTNAQSAELCATVKVTDLSAAWNFSGVSGEQGTTNISHVAIAQYRYVLHVYSSYIVTVNITLFQCIHYVSQMKDQPCRISPLSAMHLTECWLLLDLLVQERYISLPAMHAWK